MHNIYRANISHAKLLSELTKKTFLVPHGHSAPKEEIDKYIDKNFNVKNLKEELNDSSNVYHLIEYNGEIAGFSKIVLNQKNENLSILNTAMLSRIYLLEKFYDLSLGKTLFKFNVDLAKEMNQIGIWLAVWVENHRAISFYKKMGFKKIGDYNFEISENHSNPNHILYLEF